MRFLMIFFLIFASALFLSPDGVVAQTSDSITDSAGTENSCIAEKGSGKYTETVVACIKKPVVEATMSMMEKMSTLFKPVAAILFTIAIAFYGINIIGASGNIAKPSFEFVLRLGVVAFFSYNLGGFAESIYKVFDQLTELVTGSGYSPWTEIDKFVGKLLGFAKDPKHSEIKDGILGLLAGSWSSKAIGGMITVVGIYTLWTILGFMFEAVFLYVSSLIVIGFLLVISPLVIPFAIFNHGAQYAKEWLALLASSLIAPMIAFAIIFIFVGGDKNGNEGIFSKLVDEVFAAMPDNGEDYLENNLRSEQLYSLSQTAGRDEQEKIADLKCPKDNDGKVASDCKEAKVVPANNPAISSSSQTNTGTNKKTQKINYGEKDIEIKTKIFFALLNLGIFAFFMKAMMKQVQSVASGISGATEYHGAASGGSPLSNAGLTQGIGH